MTVETVDLILSVGESFISSTGKKYIKGDVYSLPVEEANKLLAVQTDNSIRFFKKVTVEGGKKAIPQDLNNQETHPTSQQIAESRNEESKKAYEEAKALDKADAIASATRGQGDEAIEQQLAAKARISVIGPTSSGMGEIDTAEIKRGRGRPAGVAV